MKVNLILVQCGERASTSFEPSTSKTSSDLIPAQKTVLGKSSGFIFTSPYTDTIHHLIYFDSSADTLAENCPDLTELELISAKLISALHQNQRLDQISNMKQPEFWCENRAMQYKIA